MVTRASGGGLINRDSITLETAMQAIAQHTRDSHPHGQYVLRNGTPGALTIASGVVSITKGYHTLAGESGAADTLDTINGGKDGFVLVVRAVNDAVTITVGHNTGNILLNGAANYALDSYNDTLQLIYDATLAKWLEIGRGNNG